MEGSVDFFVSAMLQLLKNVKDLLKIFCLDAKCLNPNRYHKYYLCIILINSLLKQSTCPNNSKLNPEIWLNDQI